MKKKFEGNVLSRSEREGEGEGERERETKKVEEPRQKYILTKLHKIEWIKFIIPSVVFGKKEEIRQRQREVENETEKEKEREIKKIENLSVNAMEKKCEANCLPFVRLIRLA